jgi:hypothetical protein
MVEALRGDLLQREVRVHQRPAIVQDAVHIACMLAGSAVHVDANI